MPKRYIFYLITFALVAIFDFFTHLASWVIELGTGLIDEGGGFPDDYVGSMLFAAMFAFTLYSLSQYKKGIYSKTREVTLGILGALGGLFVIAVIFTIIAWSGWTS